MLRNLQPQEEQLNTLQADLGLSQGTMSLLLLTANILVVAVYLGSTLAVLVTLLPALINLSDLISELGFIVKAVARQFERVLGVTGARIAGYACLYVAYLCAVAAGIISEMSLPTPPRLVCCCLCWDTLLLPP